MDKFLAKLEVPQEEEEAAVWKQTNWLNRDNIPLPPSRRTWGSWSYVGYWLATGVNISGWTGGSSLLSLGLTVGQAMAVTVVGNLLVSAAVVGTGMIGAKWHIGFPVYQRCVWGMRLAWFPLCNRIILSFTWAATQGWFGGQVVKNLLGAWAPGIYTMHNPFPADAGMDGADFLCYAIFMVISMPLIYVPPEYYRKPFLFASVVSTTCCFSLFIWALARAHGGGPLVGGDAFDVIGVEKATGANLGWAIVYGITSTLGGICAGILNQSDYTRFAVKPTDQIYSQLLVVPIMGTLTALIGIIVTSCAAQFYPDEGLLWAPYDLLAVIQKNGGPGARAAVFFASLAFLISQFGINCAGNLMSGGIDLASLAPKYINIRRGAYFTALLSVAFCPWKLLSGATVFISVMSGYAVFLGPMTGLIIVDYLFIHKQKLKLSALYDGTPNSVYWYNKGVNWRAPIAWICGVGPSFPGFLASVSTVEVNDSLLHLYQLCWPLGFCISGLVLYILTLVFPIDGVGEVDDRDYYGTFGPAEAFDGSDSGSMEAAREHVLDEEKALAGDGKMGPEGVYVVPATNRL